MGGSLVHHRLDGDDHARLQPGVRHSAPKLVGHLRLLVQPPADAVAGKFLDHRKSRALRVALHRGRDIADAIADVALLDSLVERLACHPQQLVGTIRHLADGDGTRQSP